MARLSSDSVSQFFETLPPYNNNLQMEEQDISAERISDLLSVEIPAINDGSKKTKFEKNSFVFAKLSGHSDPPWPARVVNLSWNNGNHCGYEVFFYGTYQVGEVLANEAWKYDEDSIAKFSNPKITSKRKRNDFFRGLIEIRNCPDIAPSQDVPDSASKIAKKLMRITANEDHLKLHAQSQTNDILSTCNPPRKKVKEPEIGMNWESSSVMTGIRKVGGKVKSSSWILKKSANDAFTFDDEDFDERSCMSEPARRSKRTRKMPYWRELEAKTNEMAARKIDELEYKAARQIDQLAAVRHDKGIKSRINYRKATPPVSSKIRGTKRDDDNKVKVNGKKLNKKSLKNTSAVCPSMSRSKNGSDEHSTRAQIFTSRDISPRPQMRSQATENQQARLPDTDADSTENEEALENSNLVVRRGRNKANLKPGTKSDITDCVIVKEEPASQNPRDWTVAQTVAAIVRMEPDIAPEDINAIRDHKINGKALLKLSFHDLVSYCQVKVGPASMLSTLVEKWKNDSRQFE